MKRFPVINYPVRACSGMEGMFDFMLLTQYVETSCLLKKLMYTCSGFKVYGSVPLPGTGQVRWFLKRF